MEEIIKFLGLENNVGQNAVMLDKSLFRLLESKKPECTVYAIDGGSATIIDGATWCISKLKVGVVSYKNGKRLSEKVEGFMLGISKNKNKLSSKLQPHIEGFRLESGKSSMEDLENASRSILEWLKLRQLVLQANKGDIILRDGAFSSDDAYEKSLINGVIELCKQKGIHLVGICKTSRASTPGGRPLIGMLNEFSSKEFHDKKWIYDEGGTAIAKLHEKSDFCFRIESSHVNLLPNALSHICYYSTDPEFIGYPYPLLKADKIARVRDFEKNNDNRKAKMLAKSLGNQFMEFDERATLVHDMLDKRAYR
ncbi:MAG: DNA double-strand break repair nuclease NurA [Candidatus Nanoarchaeia archaeon]|nr:DNA double-strand break repair nuclease NurA [Candidatus Nanoarchaeia archaeon]MDD5239388.1 DNA double-strand break repair nuclease NurA [Candidatus Nanoarchaeia archaeon]